MVRMADLATDRAHGAPECGPAFRCQADLGGAPVVRRDANDHSLSDQTAEKNACAGLVHLKLFPQIGQGYFGTSVRREAQQERLFLRREPLSSCTAADRAVERSE